MPVARKVTIADIARYVGMTNITVSRALNRPELVKPATRERIRQAATELGYVPNAFARALKRSDSRLIGVVTASIDNPFYAEMIKAISRHAKEHDYAIMLFDTDGDPGLESMAIDSLLSYQAAGVILSPVSDEPGYQPDYMARLEASSMAVVQLDRMLDSSDFSAVVLDNVSAGENAARYLLERMPKDSQCRLLVVAGPEQSHITRQRLTGVKALLAQRSSRVVVDVLWGDYTLTPAYEAVKDYLLNAPPPAAIFGFNQLITLGALRALRERGVDYRSLGLVGIDRLPYLDIFGINVPCVVHDGYHAGREALVLLLEQLSPNYRPRTVMVRGKLVM